MLFTKYGFFSVVNTPNYEFVIRSRERSHLENLRESVMSGPNPPNKPETILKDDGTDYEYRMYATPEEWNTVWAPKLFQSIDYPNFKSKVHELVQEELVPREYEDLLADVYFDCLPRRTKEYAFEVSKDRV